MRTTLNIDDELLGQATQLSGLREKTAVVRAGLEALSMLGLLRKPGVTHVAVAFNRVIESSATIGKREPCVCSMAPR